MSNPSKKEIRKKVLSLRDNINESTKKEWDNLIFDKLVNSQEYKNSQTISIFVSYASEVDTINIIKRMFDDHKKVCVPRVISKENGMKMYALNSFKDLNKGFKGIPEPSIACTEISPKEIDLIVIPGSAFDRTGSRIGYGGGFYDRYLQLLDITTKQIAISYSIQLLEHVPTEPFDLKVPCLITDQGRFTFEL